MAEKLSQRQIGILNSIAQKDRVTMFQIPEKDWNSLFERGLIDQEEFAPGVFTSKVVLTPAGRSALAPPRSAHHD